MDFQTRTTGKINTWPRHFAHWFDKVFGEKHWSWRCFLPFLSCLSCRLRDSFDFMDALVRPDEIRVLTSEPTGFVIQLLIFTVICNFIPDYFSLLETRFIIKQMERTQSVFRHALWLGVDFFITLMITIILPFLYLLFVVETPFWASPESITVWNYIKEVVTLSGYVFYNYSPIPYYSIIFFTSFFTSIWIWFYVLSGVVIRLFSGWRFLKTTVELDQKPVSYLGFTTILLLTVACTVVWSMPEQT
ncbi:MAG: hypothetical protein H6696_08130 [Deferribacteres bacterium]|nr:hypothetical protein [Deferribacteres bacterium]